MTTDPLTRLFMALAGEGFPGPDRLNVAPTESVPVIACDAGGRRVAEMRWWLVPTWSKEPSTKYAMFNARAEKLTSSNAFRTPFARRRALVPVSGFYEWTTDGDGRKTPHHVVADGDDGLILAGLWDRWEREGKRLESFTLVTTEAHERLRWLHDRQPVMLTRAEAERWADPEAGEDELLALTEARARVPLAVAPVSRRVNNARWKEPGCLEPDGPARHLPADD
jgi:putative SOS response-associated peptidase YedK